MDTSINTSYENTYGLAQKDDEVFDIYQAPPSKAYYNRVITPEWGGDYFPSPTTTGETKTRRLIHQDGDWHRSVQVWIVQKIAKDDKVQVLL